jgi:hypothetical protein
MPFDPGDAMVLVVATLVPMAPLLLTVYPTSEVIDLRLAADRLRHEVTPCR